MINIKNQTVALKEKSLIFYQMKIQGIINNSIEYKIIENLIVQEIYQMFYH